jgi:hypothetical protein
MSRPLTTGSIVVSKNSKDKFNNAPHASPTPLDATKPLPIPLLIEAVASKPRVRARLAAQLKAVQQIKAHSATSADLSTDLDAIAIISTN